MSGRARVVVARAAVGVALLTAAVLLPGMVRDFLVPALPVIGLWGEPAAQMRLAVAPVPYDLLREADARLPKGATVLLLTPGRDVRHREYATYHRALYLLAPRPVWWQAPAAGDGTWESRWWIDAPATVAAVEATARARGASHVLAVGLDRPLGVGVRIAAWPAGELVRLGAAAAGEATLLPAPVTLPRLWPLWLLLAAATVLALGHGALGSLAPPPPDRGLLEGIALAWLFGAGLVSLATLALGLAGIGSGARLAVLVAAAIACLAGSRRHGRAPRPEPPAPEAGPDARVAVSGRTLARGAVTGLLVVTMAVVALLAAGRPLTVWDSWVSWGMKARVAWLDGGVQRTLWAEPSRAVTNPDYPLLLPLTDAFLFDWLGVPDDRLAGLIPLGFYLALPALVHGAARRRRSGPTLAAATAVAAACLPGIALVAGSCFADVAVAALAVAAGAALVDWLAEGGRASLVVAAGAGGLLPWTKREGLVLLAALVVATLLVGRGARRARQAALALAAAGLVLAGPWWAVTASDAVTGGAFAALSPATLVANLGRLPTLAGMVIAELASPRWGFVFPLALLVGVVGRRASDDDERAEPVGLAVWTTTLYLAAITPAYLFSAYAPWQQHVASSFFRLAAQVAPLVVLWLAASGRSRTADREETSGTLDGGVRRAPGGSRADV